MEAQVKDSQQTLTEAYGTDFEKAVVWMVLHDDEYASSMLPVFKPTSFEVVPHRIVVDTIKVMRDAHGGSLSYPILVTELNAVRVTLPEKSTRRADYDVAVRMLLDLRHVTYTAADIAYVKAKTQAYLQRAEVRTALLESIALWQKGDYEAVKNKVDDAVNANVGTSPTADSLGLSFDKPLYRFKRYTSTIRSVKRFPLDVPKIDTYIRNGLEPGALGLIMAPPARGKSLMLVQATTAALLRGFNVALVSLELSETDYAQRLDARFTGIPINSINADPMAHAHAVVMASKKFLKGRLQIKRMAAETTTVSDIRVWLQMLKTYNNFVPDLLVVDYLDLLQHQNKRGDRADVGSTGRILRNLGAEMNMGVWSASQTNRAGINKIHLGLEDTAEDIQKTHVADVILGLAQSQKEKQNNSCRFIILKNRQGGCEGSTVYCHVETNTMTVTQAQNQPVIK